MKNKRKKNGFTLVELIVYIGIVSIIFVGIGYFVSDVFSSQAKSQSYVEVLHNTQTILDTISREIRESESIVSVTSSELVLLKPGASGVVIRFESADDSIVIDSGSGPIRLSNNSVSVTGQFNDLSFQNRSHNVGLELAVSRLNPSSLIDYEADITINTAIELAGK